MISIFFRRFSLFWFAIDFIQHKAVLRVFWKAFLKNFTYYYLVQFSCGPGNVFKQYFALEFFSVAYFFPMINFELV